MRRKPYGYKSYGKGYRASSYRSYKGYGRKRVSPVSVIIIILICVILLGEGLAACIYFGVFGDGFLRKNKEENIGSAPTVSESLPENSTAQISKQEKQLEGKWAENVYLYGNEAYEPFNAYEPAAKEYAQTVSSVKKELGDKINMYLMVVPSHSLTGLPEKERSKIGSDERKSIDSIYSSADKKIKCINVCDTLEKHKSEYTYFRTDTNWTALGAYYAYEQFCSKAGLNCTQLKTLTSGKTEGFRGNLYTATITDEKPEGNEILSQNPDTVIYYKTECYCRLLENGDTEDREVPMIAEFASGSNAYSTFIWGNNPYMKIETENKSGRKLCIIKDSLGCAFVPFTATVFDEIFVVDPAYYEGNIIDYIKDNKYTDVLILNSSSTANNTERVGELKTIL